MLAREAVQSAHPCTRLLTLCTNSSVDITGKESRLTRLWSREMARGLIASRYAERKLCIHTLQNCPKSALLCLQVSCKVVPLLIIFPARFVWLVITRPFFHSFHLYLALSCFPCRPLSYRVVCCLASHRLLFSNIYPISAEWTLWIRIGDNFQSRLSKWLCLLFGRVPQVPM